MKILFLYQDIISGSNISANSLIRQYQCFFPEDQSIVYRQKSHISTGSMSFFINLCWSIFDYWRVINRTSADIIYSTVYTFALAQHLSRRNRTPSVFHIHGDQTFTQTVKASAIKNMYRSAVSIFVFWLQSFAVKKSTYLCHVSHEAMESFLQKYHLSDYTTKSVVVFNGVNTKIYHPVSILIKNQLKKKYHCENKQIISYVGRIDEKKGIHEAVQSLRFISNRKICLMIAHPVCDDKYSQKYFKQISAVAKNLKKRLIFIENPANISEIYQMSDCLVLPSKQEMAPLVVLEALSCGTMPLCTDVGNNKYVLRKLWKYSYLPSVNSKSIAKKINSFLSLPIRKKDSISKTCRSIAMGYSWEKSVFALRTVFQKITQ